MSQLVMCTPERLRERTEEQKDMDQTNWVRSLPFLDKRFFANEISSESNHMDGTAKIVPTSY